MKRYRWALFIWVEKGITCVILQEIAQELNQIREQLRTSEERHTADKDGSLFALQTAQAHLKERYARMKKENEELQKHLTEYNQKQVFYL